MVIKAAKKKVCMYCEQKREPDYKNYEELRNFMTERGRIKSRKQTGLCAKHQRRLTTPERLYIFAKKLKTFGEIRIRSDNYDFIEFTKETAESLECFEIEEGRLKVSEPLTKYEAKWLSMGRELYKLVLRKVREPKFVEHPKIEEVKELFPVKIPKVSINKEKIQNTELKLGDKVYFKTFKVWEGEKGYLIESLLSEEGYYQKFFIEVKVKDNGIVIDVSPFSEVLRTRNLQRAIEKVAELLSS